MDCFGTYFTHVQRLWCNPCSKCYGMDLLWAILHTCPKLWCNPCSNLWCNPLDDHEWNGLAKESKLESSKMSLCVRLWKTKNLMFFFRLSVVKSSFPLAKRQFSSWSHGHATRNTCASTSGLFKSTTNTTFQVPELRITKKRNVVHARAPYQPATLFFHCHVTFRGSNWKDPHCSQVVFSFWQLFFV